MFKRGIGVSYPGTPYLCRRADGSAFWVADVAASTLKAGDRIAITVDINEPVHAVDRRADVPIYGYRGSAEAYAINSIGRRPSWDNPERELVELWMNGWKNANGGSSMSGCYGDCEKRLYLGEENQRP